MVKYPWDDEPTPLTDAEVKRRDDLNFPPDQSYSSDPDADFARDLERRLRHALKLVNSLRIDCMHGELDCEYIEQRLADIEEVLQ